MKRRRDVAEEAVVDASRINAEVSIYISDRTKHLIDTDEEVLYAAQAELGTRTTKGTVHEALRRVTGDRKRRVAVALDVLADADLDECSQA